MKKIILIFTIIISFFIFDVSFKEASRSEYLAKSSLSFNLEELKGYKTSGTQFQLNDENKKEFLHDLLAFLKENKISASIIDSNNVIDFAKSESWYVHFENEDLSKQIFTIEEGRYLDFHMENKQYYTTDLNDDKSDFHIAYLDKIYNDKFHGEINIYSLEKYEETDVFKLRTSAFVNFHGKELDGLKKKISKSSLSKYMDENSSFGEVSSFKEYDVSDEYLSVKIIGIITLSILLLMICFIVEIRKEIILRKMFGMNNFNIINKIFTKDLIFLCLIYIATQIALYFFYVRNFYPNALEFIGLLIRYFIFFILGILIIYIIIYVIIKLLVNIKFMKKEKSNSKLLWLNFSLKLIAILLLMQPCITQTQKAIESTQLLIYLNNNQERISQSIYMQGIYDDGDLDKYEEIRDEVLAYFEDHGGYFQNFSSYFFSQVNEKQTDWNPKYPFPYLEANINYLKDYQILDSDGQSIDLEQLEQDTLLIPEKYKDKNLSLYEGYPNIYITDGYEFFNNGVSTDTSQLKLSNPIIKVYTSIPVEHEMGNGFATVMLPVKDEQTLVDLKQYLKDQNIQQNVILGNNEDNYKIISNYTLNTVIQSWVMMFIQWLTILIFLFETMYLFVLQERKLYALRYLCGESFIERYGDLFITNFAIYLIVAVVGLISNISLFNVIGFVLPIMIFESGVSYLILRMYERKNILSALKGD